MKIPRISNPYEFVDVIFTDMGDVRPCCDKFGNSYEGYTSKFEFKGKCFENHVSRDFALYWSTGEDSGNMTVSKYRYMQDCAFLEKFDLNLAKVIFNE